MITTSLISLGCSKNQVDSELMLGVLSKDDDICIIDNPANADIIIINTCGFIQDAREESIDTIIQAGQLKKQGQCKSIIVTGCLTQRYRDEILNELPEVDAIIGTSKFDEITNILKLTLSGNRVNRVASPAFSYKSSQARVLSELHYAYVKIAEGCNNNCSYCSIPRIRGPLYSRQMEDIYEEVAGFVEKGVKEIILVAQDTTCYGLDIYGKPALADLLEKLNEIKNLKWLRIMYSYPERINNRLISIMANSDKICNYLDLPVQHSSNKIRKRMNRTGRRSQLLTRIKKIRREIPGIALRTSLIVGFPGETDEDFRDLIDFIQQIRFDRLGVFKYSAEEDTPASSYSGQIPEDIKEERYQKIMEIQREISYNNNQRLVGKNIEVLIDEITDEYAIGRSRYDAPEIDNQVYLAVKSYRKGDLLYCKVSDAYEYDLIGEIIK
ncbi:30S ribosomal protein S12 methylthiotransferase RimO [Iocasia frigidifontis]|uniref:Ribosomal protein uS12 methylthiotransferase RimO n=1 Tax=Iocasia fonsfrigidae TaxID=2682810 RepID=A0A8A7KF77_9FIRM|nr:30S ribosomal protein S12 methylthiotransferase RimO [Iocasia fonsfrigidae]QTL98348.1 30S ribosomal protein S12 methylthiotransferase RimO [Iocasia fonsfrigidae]